MGEEILVEERDGVLAVTFNRPQARNAMTFAMYEGLVGACDRADADPGVRVLTLRGAGGSAFVAGTDIAQFAGFDGDAGVAYEERIDAVITRLLAVDVPVVAAVDGFCIGGGLAIASAADIRIAHPSARFGYPIARTLGNTLSAASFALAVRQFGHARTLDMLLSARLLDAEEARFSGFVSEITEDVTASLDALVGRLLGHAPLTMWAAKETLRRLHRATVEGVDTADVVHRIYGSADFAEGQAAFVGKRKPGWAGR